MNNWGYTDRNDVAAFRRLREEGKTNKEIAAIHGISTTTVARALGPMTAEERSRAAKTGHQNRNYNKKPAAVNKPAAVPAPRMSGTLRQVSMLVQLEGLNHSYVLDTEERTVSVSAPECVTRIYTEAELNAYIDELTQLSNSFKVLAPKKEEPKAEEE